jgi:hypothetical protein
MLCRITLLIYLAFCCHIVNAWKPRQTISNSRKRVAVPINAAFLSVLRGGGSGSDESEYDPSSDQQRNQQTYDSSSSEESSDPDDDWQEVIAASPSDNNEKVEQSDSDAAVYRAQTDSALDEAVVMNATTTSPMMDNRSNAVAVNSISSTTLDTGAEKLAASMEQRATQTEAALEDLEDPVEKDYITDLMTAVAPDDSAAAATAAISDNQIDTSIKVASDDVSMRQDETTAAQEPTIGNHEAVSDNIHNDSAATALEENDSSAFVDRMDLADVYDEGETSFGSDDARIVPVDIPSASSTVPESSDAPTSTPLPTTAATILVPVEITDAMKKTLKKLKYRNKEISIMRPDIAAVVVQKNLPRPVSGIPENWYTPGSRGPKRTQIQKLLCIFAPMAAIAAAIFLGGGAELWNGGNEWTSLFSHRQSRSKQEKQPLRTLSSPTAHDIEYYKKIIQEATGTVKPINEHVTRPNQPHARSIHPGSSTSTVVGK